MKLVEQDARDQRVLREMMELTVRLDGQERRAHRVTLAHLARLELVEKEEIAATSEKRVTLELRAPLERRVEPDRQAKLERRETPGHKV